ncbi:hypothetical protein ACI798_11755 [Geodermatophilus sp. SYSU D01045]
MDLQQLMGRATGLASGAGAALLHRLQHVRMPGAGQDVSIIGCVHATRHDTPPHRARVR